MENKSLADALAEREFAAAFSEAVNNDTLIEWSYWVHQMPTLTAGEAARLMSGLDPRICEVLDAKDQRRPVKNAVKIQLLAEREAKVLAKPAEWFAWASDHQIEIHDGFRLEVESMHTQIEASPVATAKAEPVANWKMQVQAEATAFCLRLRKSGANPTRHSIVEPMAQWCRDSDIRTVTKIHPSANYLRTHVLGGKHWDVPN